MESAHPIPQNVTTFEFHLIGDMTLKQFLYLATGVGIAYLVFVFAAAPAPIVAWPIIIISSFLGIAFAFIPIADRPLDHWLKAFLKATYSPTQLTWKKDSKLFNDEPLFKGRLNVYLSSQSQPQPKTTPPASPPANRGGPTPLPTSEELIKTVKLANQAQSLQVKIIEAERELSQIKTQVESHPTDPKAYTGQFNAVFSSLQQLVEEGADIKQELARLTNEPVIPAGEVQVRVVSVPKPKPTQVTLTSVPNIINGIVVDSGGNYLDSVVVVIHDKEGLPVRALKTNKLGQFSGSTPLPNGTYNVELEKDGLVFDILQISLEGKLLAPIIIAAKKV